MPKANSTIISNTTPIISLLLIDQLSLYKKLYDEVWIPPAVENELLAHTSRLGAVQFKPVYFIKTIPLQNPRSADLLGDLDRGEAEVITLALEQNADLVIIDERLGRRHAQRLGLSVTGVLGILLKSKQRGFIDEVAPLLKQLTQSGIHLSSQLIAQALRLANE